MVFQSLSLQNWEVKANLCSHVLSKLYQDLVVKQGHTLPLMQSTMSADSFTLQPIVSLQRVSACVSVQWAHFSPRIYCLFSILLPFAHSLMRPLLEQSRKRQIHSEVSHTSHTLKQWKDAFCVPCSGKLLDSWCLTPRLEETFQRLRSTIIEDITISLPVTWEKGTEDAQKALKNMRYECV